MAERFRPGDRVRHTDGGPIMGVKGYQGGKVICSWYKPHEGWQQQTFKEDALKRVGRSRSPDR